MKVGRFRVPSVMVVALLASVTSTVLYCLARRGLSAASENREIDQYVRYIMLDGAATFVLRMAVVAAFLEVASRVGGTTRQLLRVAAAMFAFVAVWRLAGFQIFDLVGADDGHARALELIDGGAGILILVATVLVVIATRAVPGLAILAVVSVFVGPWLPVVGTAFHKAFVHHEWAGIAISAMTELAWLVSIAGMLGAIGARTADEPEPAAAVWGFRRIEAGLLLRAASPILVFFAALMALRSNQGLKVVIVLGGLATTTSWGLIGAGTLAAGRAGLPGLAPARLYPAAALVIAWTALTLVQFLTLYAELTGKTTWLHEQADALTVAGPIVGLAGLVALGWGVGGLAAARGDEDLREAALARTIVIVIIDASVLAIMHQLQKATTRDIAMLLLICATIASVIGTLAFAKLFRRAATAVETTPALPSARLVAKGDS